MSANQSRLHIPINRFFYQGVVKLVGTVEGVDGKFTYTFNTLTKQWKASFGVSKEVGDYLFALKGELNSGCKKDGDDLVIVNNTLTGKITAKPSVEMFPKDGIEVGMFVSQCEHDFTEEETTAQSQLKYAFTASVEVGMRNRLL